VVKSKTMLGEEIGLNGALEALGVQVVETDLGEYIIQLAGERPAHITGPCIHMSLEDVRKLFSKHAGTELPSQPEALTAYARAQLRERSFRRHGHQRLATSGWPAPAAWCWSPTRAMAAGHQPAAGARGGGRHGAAGAGLEQPDAAAHGTAAGRRLRAVDRLRDGHHRPATV